MTTALEIDLNCDLGESFGAWTMGNDAALLDIVTSANIACGFHAGDSHQMATTVAAAAERGVRIGAHVSYPDKAGFGRRAMAVSPADIATDTLYQLGALDAFARAAGTRVRYVKAHGALYHRIAQDAQAAHAVIHAMQQYDPALRLLTLPGCIAFEAAVEAGINAVAEAFADRAYECNGQLVSRREEGAVITDAQQVVARMVELVRSGHISSRDGSPLALSAQSICVHGDTPGAVSLASQLRDGLQAAGIRLKAFT